MKKIIVLLASSLMILAIAVVGLGFYAPTPALAAQSVRVSGASCTSVHVVGPSTNPPATYQIFADGTPVTVYYSRTTGGTAHYYGILDLQGAGPFQVGGGDAKNWFTVQGPCGSPTATPTEPPPTATPTSIFCEVFPELCVTPTEVPPTATPTQQCDEDCQPTATPTEVENPTATPTQPSEATPTATKKDPCANGACNTSTPNATATATSKPPNWDWCNQLLNGLPGQKDPWKPGTACARHLGKGGAVQTSWDAFWINVQMWFASWFQPAGVMHAQ